MVGLPGQRSGRHYWISGSSRETLTEVRELSGCPAKGPRGPTGYPVVVGRPSRRSGNGREALPQGTGLVVRPPRRSGNGREAIPVVR